MIITKISGGLGNQMFQYAVARSISNLRNQELKLDVRSYLDYKLFDYKLDLFDIKATLATEREIVELKGGDNLFSRIKRRALSRYFFPLYYKEKERTIFDPDVFNRDNLYLDGYWQNEKYFDNIRCLLLNDFVFKGNYSSAANKYSSLLKSTNSVSIHVRRGDYSKHPEIGILDIDYYKRAVSIMTEKLDNPTYFVFSNDIPWCKDYLNFIDDLIIVENTESEIEDMMLMRQCAHNIIANSSFSWWGAWLNENDHKVVVCPEKWMAINPKNHKWTPQAWVEV